MNKMTVYDRIERMLKTYGGPIAPHEIPSNTRQAYQIPMTESALGRRLRELRELGRVGSRTREGKSYKEFWVIEKEKK